MQKVHVILDNIRSTHNVGSIFRTGDAAGVEKIYLAGHTPAPIDRFGRKQKDIAKVALGAEEEIVWEQTETTEEAIQKAKEEGFTVVAVEQDKKAKDYRELSKEKSLAFVFGREVEGLPKEILDKCDEVVEIPMHGKKESLNVSVTAGVILFTIR